MKRRSGSPSAPVAPSSSAPTRSQTLRGRRQRTQTRRYSDSDPATFTTKVKKSCQTSSSSSSSSRSPNGVGRNQGQSQKSFSSSSKARQGSAATSSSSSSSSSSSFFKSTNGSASSSAAATAASENRRGDSCQSTPLSSRKRPRKRPLVSFPNSIPSAEISHYVSTRSIVEESATSAALAAGTTASTTAAGVTATATATTGTTTTIATASLPNGNPSSENAPPSFSWALCSSTSTSYSSSSSTAIKFSPASSSILWGRQLGIPTPPPKPRWTLQTILPWMGFPRHATATCMSGASASGDNDNSNYHQEYLVVGDSSGYLNIYSTVMSASSSSSSSASQSGAASSLFSSSSLSSSSASSSNAASFSSSSSSSSPSSSHMLLVNRLSTSASIREEGELDFPIGVESSHQSSSRRPHHPHNLLPPSTRFRKFDKRNFPNSITQIAMSVEQGWVVLSTDHEVECVDALGTCASSSSTSSSSTDVMWSFPLAPDESTSIDPSSTTTSSSSSSSSTIAPTIHKMDVHPITQKILCSLSIPNAHASKHGDESKSKWKSTSTTTTSSSTCSSSSPLWLLETVFDSSSSSSSSSSSPNDDGNGDEDENDVDQGEMEWRPIWKDSFRKTRNAAAHRCILHPKQPIASFQTTDPASASYEVEQMGHRCCAIWDRSTFANRHYRNGEKNSTTTTTGNGNDGQNHDRKRTYNRFVMVTVVEKLEKLDGAVSSWKATTAESSGSNSVPSSTLNYELWIAELIAKPNPIRSANSGRDADADGANGSNGSTMPSSSPSPSFQSSSSSFPSTSSTGSFVVLQRTVIPTKATKGGMADCNVTQSPSGFYTLVASSRGIRLYETSTLQLLKVYGDNLALHGHTLVWQDALFLPKAPSRHRRRRNRPHHQQQQHQANTGASRNNNNKKHQNNQNHNRSDDHHEDDGKIEDEILFREQYTPIPDTEWMEQSACYVVGVPHKSREPRELQGTLHVWDLLEGKHALTTLTATASEAATSQPSRGAAATGGYTSVVTQSAATATGAGVHHPQILVATLTNGDLYTLRQTFQTDWPGIMYPPGYHCIHDNLDFVEDEDELDVVVVQDDDEEHLYDDGDGDHDHACHDEQAQIASEAAEDRDLAEALRRSLLEQQSAVEEIPVDVLGLDYHHGPCDGGKKLPLKRHAPCIPCHPDPWLILGNDAQGEGPDDMFEDLIDNKKTSGPTRVSPRRQQGHPSKRHHRNKQSTLARHHHRGRWADDFGSQLLSALPFQRKALQTEDRPMTRDTSLLTLTATTAEGGGGGGGSSNAFDGGNATQSSAAAAAKPKRGRQAALEILRQQSINPALRKRMIEREYRSDGIGSKRRRRQCVSSTTIKKLPSDTSKTEEAVSMAEGMVMTFPSRDESNVSIVTPLSDDVETMETTTSTSSASSSLASTVVGANSYNKPPVDAVDSHEEEETGIVRRNSSCTATSKHENGEIEYANNYVGGGDSGEVDGDEDKGCVFGKGSVTVGGSVGGGGGGDSKDATAAVQLATTCPACQYGRNVIHECGKREIPVDHDAIERAEEERKRKQQEEEKRAKVERRKLADAKRREAKKQKKEEELESQKQQQQRQQKELQQQQEREAAAVAAKRIEEEAMKINAERKRRDEQRGRAEMLQRLMHEGNTDDHRRNDPTAVGVPRSKNSSNTPSVTATSTPSRSGNDCSDVVQPCPPAQQRPKPPEPTRASSSPFAREDIQHRRQSTSASSEPRPHHSRPPSTPSSLAPQGSQQQQERSDEVLATPSSSKANPVPPNLHSASQRAILGSEHCKPACAKPSSTATKPSQPLAQLTPQTPVRMNPHPPRQSAPPLSGAMTATTSTPQLGRMSSLSSSPQNEALAVLAALATGSCSQGPKSTTSYHRYVMNNLGECTTPAAPLSSPVAAMTASTSFTCSHVAKRKEDREYLYGGGGGGASSTPRQMPESQMHVQMTPTTTPFGGGCGNRDGPIENSSADVAPASAATVRSSPNYGGSIPSYASLGIKFQGYEAKAQQQEQQPQDNATVPYHHGYATQVQPTKAATTTTIANASPQRSGAALSSPLRPPVTVSQAFSSSCEVRAGDTHENKETTQFRPRTREAPAPPAIVQSIPSYASLGITFGTSSMVSLEHNSARSVQSSQSLGCGEGGLASTQPQSQPTVPGYASSIRPYGCNESGDSHCSTRTIVSAAALGNHSKSSFLHVAKGDDKTSTTTVTASTLQNFTPSSSSMLVSTAGADRHNYQNSNHQQQPVFTETSSASHAVSSPPLHSKALANSTSSPLSSSTALSTHQQQHVVQLTAHHGGDGGGSSSSSSSSSITPHGFGQAVAMMANASTVLAKSGTALVQGDDGGNHCSDPL